MATKNYLNVSVCSDGSIFADFATKRERQLLVEELRNHGGFRVWLIDHPRESEILHNCKVYRVGFRCK